MTDNKACPSRGKANDEVSNEGRVRSIARKSSKQKDLSQNLTMGYPTVSLCLDGYVKKAYVHHLVAMAFIGNPPGPLGCKSGQYTVNHKDFDRTNNRLENLEWMTNIENKIHAWENGRVVQRKGESHASAKLSYEDVTNIRHRILLGESASSIASDYKVVRSTIFAIKKGRSWAS
jgi:HNH endonuclease/NUMOD4 motif